jgi:hypothetical protein
MLSDHNQTISQLEQEKLEKLKQEHFKDLINESKNQFVQSNHQRNYQGNQTSESRLPPRAPLEKVYGNLGDVVAYEERIIEQQMRLHGARPYSPNSSQMNLKKVAKQHDKHGSRRMTGLEAIYL